MTDHTVTSPPIASAAATRGGALPAIADALSRSEWSAIAGSLLLLAVLAVDGDVVAHRDAGQIVGHGVATVGALLRTAIWLAMARWIFRALDRLPFTAGNRTRALAGRAAVAVGATIIQHAVGRALAAAAGSGFGPPPASFAADWPRVYAVLGGSFDYFLYLLAAHMIAQRVHRTRAQRQRHAELEASLVRAQLHALTQELRPHFLFNALNGIVALLREEPARAEAMIIGLSELLRRTLEVPSEGKVTLAAELEHLDLYLSLERMRFGPRLVVTRTMAENTLATEVPAMLLQPIVENALTHGIGPMPGPGELSLEAVLIGHRLRLTVRDTGSGLPPDSHERESTGIGSTRARLTALYGNDFRFEIGAPPVGAGTLVTIEFPARRAADQ